MRAVLAVLSCLAAFGACGDRASKPTAVYYAGPKPAAQRSEVDLSGSVIEVDSFSELQAFSEEPIALWVDAAVAPSVTSAQLGWLNKRSRMGYPVAVVGSCHFLWAFRELLPFLGIGGPRVDWGSQTIEPGFVVVCVDSVRVNADGEYLSGAYRHQAFEETPTRSRVLAVTDSLLGWVRTRERII